MRSEHAIDGLLRSMPLPARQKWISVLKNTADNKEALWLAINKSLSEETFEDRVHSIMDDNDETFRRLAK